MQFLKAITLGLLIVESDAHLYGLLGRRAADKATSSRTYDRELFEYAQFPTLVFTSYYIPPTATQEPQPAIYDAVLGRQFPLNLTDPSTVDLNIEKAPSSLPPPWNNVTIIDKNGYVAGLSKKPNLSLVTTAKSLGPTCAPLVSQSWKSLKLSPKNYQATFLLQPRQSDSQIFALIQILQLADLKYEDGQWLCNRMWGYAFCTAPTTPSQSTLDLIPKPKPSNAMVPPPGGERVKVVHLSDIHIDPRYSAGASASNFCRIGCPPSKKILDPAPLYGSYSCDAPYYLVTSALSSVGPLTGTGSESNSNLAWTIYTGDLVPHESNAHITADYVSYIETSVYYLLQKMLPSGPIYAVLGNHDQGHEAFLPNNGRPGTFGDQQEQNYDHVTKLWQNAGWLDPTAVDDARKHYTAYAVVHPEYPQLRIITINTDLWYIQNPYNFAQSMNPDYSGLFTFLVTELQAAEDTGQRVWILGHVPPGWDGTQAMPGHSDLLYQIVARYSPHVIAEIFFGHTHNDQVSVYYNYNDTNQVRGPIAEAATALATAWIAPSITPLGGLNSAWRMYLVDTGDFHLYDSYTFSTDVSKFSALDQQHRDGGSDHTPVAGPVWNLEYSARNAYGPAVNWPKEAPLDATFWHRVTEAMKHNSTLVGGFNLRQTRGVGMGCGFDLGCVKQTVCRIRSGSVALGLRCGWEPEDAIDERLL